MNEEALRWQEILYYAAIAAACLVFAIFAIASFLMSHYASRERRK